MKKPLPTHETTSYGGWPNCVRISDGKTEAIVTTDVGPRIIRFAPVGGENQLKEFPEQLGRTGGKEWRIYGGHRLWVAPEDADRSYVPDNKPVEWSWRNPTLTLKQAADVLYGLAKEMRLRWLADGSLEVKHRLINRSRRKVELAPWALTVMAPGGEAVIPQEPYAPHPEALVPVRPLVLWAYSNMSDPRWTWGDREIRLRQDRRRRAPLKVGLFSRQGWMAYVRDGYAFIKKHPVVTGKPHPDYGCNVQTFTNQDMLELETLGPLVTLKPGARAELIEQWQLHKVRGNPGLKQLARLATT